MMDYDARIAELEEQLDSLARREAFFQETVFLESIDALRKQIDALHESVDALHETVDKLHRRVDYQSEWCQSLQEHIGHE